MKKKMILKLLSIIAVVSFFTTFLYAQPKINRSEALKVGNTIPNAKLERFGQNSIEINDLVGKIKMDAKKRYNDDYEYFVSPSPNALSNL